MNFLFLHLERLLFFEPHSLAISGLPAFIPDRVMEPAYLPAYSDRVIFLGLAPEDLYMFVPLNQTETEFDRKSAYSTVCAAAP
jgi:hypothetical protein